MENTMIARRAVSGGGACETTPDAAGSEAGKADRGSAGEASPGAPGGRGPGALLASGSSAPRTSGSATGRPSVRRQVLPACLPVGERDDRRVAPGEGAHVAAGVTAAPAEVEVLDRHPMRP